MIFISQSTKKELNLPCRSYDLDLGEYCYRIGVTLSQNGSCPVAAAEEIAAVISALMNTSGGVLAVCVDITRCQKPISLKKSKEKIVNIITEREKWIPGILFPTFVKLRVIEERQEIVFFVNKADHFVTHITNAYHSDGNEVKPLCQYQSVCSGLRGCCCTAERLCNHHLNTTAALTSSLTDSMRIATLDFQMRLSPLEGTTCKYKAYSSHGRNLNELLKSSSVQDDIRKIVSALANGDGGSLLLGVTDTDTPVVKGCTWGTTTLQEVEQLLSEIIDGKEDSRVSIWSNPTLEKRQWKLFVHLVNGCDEEIRVVEIRVPQCVGGMFCAMPVGFVINTSGEISSLEHFWEWKKTMLQSLQAEHKEDATVENHFEVETMDNEPTVQPPARPDKQPEGTNIDPSNNTPEMKDTQRDKVFQWWATGRNDVIGESYSFDECCARNLAEEVMNPKTFTLFPSIESTMEHKRDSPDLKLALLEIQERYEEDMGVGILIENIEDPSGELNLITGTNQVLNVVILRQSRRPMLISLVGGECTTSLAKRYTALLACLFKRLCLLTYRSLCNRNTYLCFERQVYRIGMGFEPLVENISYPPEYLTPNPGTIDIVRYTLAGILLRCEPLVDRFGNIMVRHLSACQARFLLKKRSKVTLVEGKAGSGKSVLALETIRRIKLQQGGKSKIVFLCRGRGLAAFIKYQAERMDISIEPQTVSTESVEELTEEFFSQYTDVFIDDAHSIPLTGSPNCRALYDSLFSSLRKPDSRAYIFFDPEMQDYRGCISTDFAKLIRNTAAFNSIKGRDVDTVCLDKILRNSYRICKFLKANMDALHEEELQAIRNLPEDGIFFFYIQTHRPAPTSGLYRRVHEVLADHRYQEKNIAILTEGSGDKAWVRDILQSANYSVQEATDFPVEHIVVDTLANFEGLESPVILFIVPESWGSGYVGSLKYRLCIATRAISRLEFLVPWDPTVKQLDLLELRMVFGAEVISMQSKDPWPLKLYLVTFEIGRSSV